MGAVVDMGEFLECELLVLVGKNDTDTHYFPERYGSYDLTALQGDTRYTRALNRFRRIQACRAASGLPQCRTPATTSARPCTKQRWRTF
ncbi:MAG TPA: hypothetical protein EYP63_02885 [Desulfotomaculum sp.]|nr:hypothetical protein [Desulfotomaculum sp.]